MADGQTTSWGKSEIEKDAFPWKKYGTGYIGIIHELAASM